MDLLEGPGGVELLHRVGYVYEQVLYPPLHWLIVTLTWTFSIQIYLILFLPLLILSSQEASQALGGLGGFWASLKVLYLSLTHLPFGFLK